MRLVRHDGPAGHLYRVEGGDPLGEQCPLHPTEFLPERWTRSVTAVIDKLASPGLASYERQRVAEHVARAVVIHRDEIGTRTGKSVAQAMQHGMETARAESEARMARGTDRHTEIANAIATGEVGAFDNQSRRALTAIRRNIPDTWTLHLEVPVIACPEAVAPSATPSDLDAGWGGTIDLLAVSPDGATGVIVDWKTTDHDHPRDTPADRDRLQIAGYAAACAYQPHSGPLTAMPHITEARVVRFGQVSTANHPYRPSGGRRAWCLLAAATAAVEHIDRLMDPDT